MKANEYVVEGSLATAPTPERCARRIALARPGSGVPVELYAA